MKLPLFISVLTVTFAAGCASQPTRSDDPLSEDAAWSRADATMRRHLDRSALPRTADLDVETAEAIVSLKGAQGDRIRGELRELYQTNDLTLRTAATLRVAQLDLNTACELLTLSPTPGADSTRASLVRTVLDEGAQPSISAARTELDRARNMGAPPYAEAASELVSDYPDGSPDAMRTYCAEHVEAWQGEPTSDYVNRVAIWCDNGLSEACFIASRLVEEPEKAADFARRACADGVTRACAPDPSASADPLAATCEEGNRYACWRRAATVDPAAIETYTDACFGGSGYDCMRRGLLLERGEAILEACAIGPIPRPNTIDSARRECDTGDAKACFQLGVSTWIPPRELERLPPGPDTGEARRRGVLAGRGALPREGRESLVAACEKGDARKCRLAAYTFDEEASDRMKLLDSGCELGDPLACYGWAEGIRGNENAPAEARRRALDALRRACTNGVHAACAALGEAYAAGEDLPQSRVCAARYLMKACTPETAIHCYPFSEIFGE